LPNSVVAQVLGKQILRSGTSVGSHFREATRSRSDAEFISNVEVALQELEETVYWLVLIGEGDVISSIRLGDLMEEADRLTAILVTCVRNAKSRRE
jgi:four helix bundle protein